MPSTSYAPRCWYPPQSLVHRPGNRSSTGMRHLPKMTQLISMEPGFQPTSVCSQNPDWFCNIRLPAEKETETWGGSLGELAQGRTVAPHTKRESGDSEGRQQKLQLFRALYRTPPIFSSLDTPPPRQHGPGAIGPRAPTGWGLAWFSRGRMPRLCCGGHLQFPGVRAPGG